MAQTLAGLQALNGFVPKPQATAILTKAAEQSVVKRLSGQTPMPLTGASIAVQTGSIEAGVVGEGEAKPVGSTSYGVKSIKPIKVAAIAVVSKELTMLNPLGVWNNIQGDITNAITRAFDLAVLHGRSAKTGALIPGVEYVTQTAKTVELGTSTKQEGGLATDLINGYNLVVEDDDLINDGFTGFAADKRLRGKLIGAVDVNGRQVFQQGINLADPMDSVLGLPTAYGRAVSGKVGASADQKVRAIGGDWGALKYGFAESLSVSTSTEATIVDGDTTYNLFQDNMVAVLVEAIFGWVVTDVDSFVVYKDAA